MSNTLKIHKVLFTSPNLSKDIKKMELVVGPLKNILHKESIQTWTKKFKSSTLEYAIVDAEFDEEERYQRGTCFLVVWQKTFGNQLPL